MSRRVLIFAPAFAPACFSEGLVNSKLALAFQAAGWDPLVITISGSQNMTYTQGWPETFAPLKPCRREAAAATRPGIGKFVRLASDVIRTGHWIQGVHWGPQACAIALEEHGKKPFDLVLSRSLSCVAHLPALMFRKQHDVKWVANWNDPPPHRFPAPYHYPVSAVARRGLDRYFREVARRADINSFPSRRLAEYLKPSLGLHDDGKVRIVPHVGLAGYESHSAGGNHHGLTFCHAGNLSGERDPMPFLRALKRVVTRLGDSPPALRCHVIGTESHGLRTEIAQLGLENVVSFHGAKTYAETLAFLEKCDIALMIEAKCSEGVFLPSKVIDYAQVGKPILAVSPRIGVMSDLLSDGKAGIAADAGDEDAIEAGIRRMVAAWSENRLGEFNSGAIWREGEPAAVVRALADG